MGFNSCRKSAGPEIHWAMVVASLDLWAIGSGEKGQVLRPDSAQDAYRARGDV